jgi:uncharacterized protein YggT (Ycf19 family)
VDRANPLFVYWYFHLPNIVLAALMYTLLGRFALSFIFEPESRNYIWRAFIRLTDPVVKAVAVVTPRAVPPLLVLLLAFVWLFALRAAFLVALLAVGAAPVVGVPAQ